MTVFTFDLAANTVCAYRNKAVALKVAEAPVITGIDDLLASPLSASKMLALYNFCAPLTSKYNVAKKFGSRSEAATRTYQAMCGAVQNNMMEVDAGVVEPAPAPAPVIASTTVADGDVAVAIKPAKAPKVKAAAKPTTGKRGRKRVYAGYQIWPSKEVMIENPRREGGVGYKGLEIVRANPGITFEDYRAKSGGACNTNDVKWDIERGFVTITPPK